MAIVRKVGRQLLATRSVHLDIHPRPANLSESREVLRVLQGFGAIDIYKTLAYERPVEAPNSAFAIYRDPEAAQKALNASPIRFALETVAESEAKEDGRLEELPGGDEVLTQDTPVRDGVEEITRPSLLLNKAPEQRWGQFGGVEPSTGSSSEAVKQTVENPPQHTPVTEVAAPKAVRWFHVNVDRTRAVYQDYVERQPLYSEFSVMQSMMQQDLATRVPHVGLSDITMRPDNHARTLNRIIQKNATRIARMKTLRQLWHYARMREMDAAVEKDAYATGDPSKEAVKDAPRDSWGTLQDQIEQQAYDKVHKI